MTKVISVLNVRRHKKPKSLKRLQEAVAKKKLKAPSMADINAMVQDVRDDLCIDK